MGYALEEFLNDVIDGWVASGWTREEIEGEGE